MEVPRILFRYSWVYDDYLKSLLKNVYGEPKKELPSRKEMVEYAERARDAWQVVGEKILAEISNVTGLEWKEDYVRCYIVTAGICFSDPLTVKKFKTDDVFIDTLTHELIHNIFVQNSQFDDAFQKFRDRYEKESINAQYHVLLHAVHKAIYLKFGWEKRLEHDIEFHKKHPDYARSWEIVRTEGHEKIINEFRKTVSGN